MQAVLVSEVCSISSCLIPVSASSGLVAPYIEVAEPATQINEASSITNRESFHQFVDSGLFADDDWRNAGVGRAGNGNDCFANDALGDLVLTRSCNRPFLIGRFINNSDRAFETSGFKVPCANLSPVTFVGNARGAYENNVVSASTLSTVPVPAALRLFG